MRARSNHRPSDEQLRRWYAVLGLPLGASKKRVKAARDRLVHECHPDKHGDDSMAGRWGKARMIEINEAYRVLKRWAPAVTQAPPPPRPSPSPRPSPPPPRRPSPPPRRSSPPPRPQPSPPRRQSPPPRRPSPPPRPEPQRPRGSAQSTTRPRPAAGYGAWAPRSTVDVGAAYWWYEQRPQNPPPRVEPRRQVERDRPAPGSQQRGGSAVAWVLIIAMLAPCVWYLGTHPREFLSALGGTLLTMLIGLPISFIATFFEDE